MSREAYIALIASWSRQQILAVCRAAGLTAHRIQSNRDLAALLWDRIGQHK